MGIQVQQLPLPCDLTTNCTEHFNFLSTVSFLNCSFQLPCDRPDPPHAQHQLDDQAEALIQGGAFDSSQKMSVERPIENNFSFCMGIMSETILGVS